MKRIAYLSDVSAVPEEALAFLRRFRPEILVLDSLNRDRRHGAHFCSAEALEFVKVLRPPKAYLIGMSCDIEHHDMSEALRAFGAEEGLDVELSRDGLSLNVTA